MINIGFELVKLLPKNHLSYGMGLLAHVPLPPAMRAPVIGAFAKMYNINLDEAEKPLDQYKSVGDFFVRKLKAEARPLAAPEVVHPADARITQFSVINEGKLIQAKGKTYELADFLGDGSSITKFKDGVFATYYLCPTDYHRVHSPVSGKLLQVCHIPGNLWPVHDHSVQNVENLFSVNERVVVSLQTAYGYCDVVFVGATNVGKISLAFEPRVSSNDLRTQSAVTYSYENPIMIEKGQELGQFNMGSTVVVVYGAQFKPLLPYQVSEKYIGKQTRVRSSFES